MQPVTSTRDAGQPCAAADDRLASATGYIKERYRLHKETESMRFARRALLGAMCLLLATAALAQVTTADILGRVTDSSGAVLPGASVTIVNTATRDTRTQTTNETGDYVFNLLPIGAYAVTVELQGFQTQTTNLRVASGDRARFDPKLGLGTVNESIQVTAEAAV